MMMRVVIGKRSRRSWVVRLLSVIKEVRIVRSSSCRSGCSLSIELMLVISYILLLLLLAVYAFIVIASKPIVVFFLRHRCWLIVESTKVIHVFWLFLLLRLFPSMWLLLIKEPHLPF